MRPNILCVVMDTARADAFEPYGAPAGASPTVAQLARRGRAHEEVRAAASWTLPSHAAMLTGLLPRGLGLTQAPGGTPFGARPALEAHRDRLLAEVLRRAGYATGAVSTNLWIREGSGFDLGFERFRTVSPNRQSALDRTDVRGRIRWLAEGVRARADDGAAEAGAVLRDWAAEAAGDGRPFFWFVNLVECHSPYLPPRPYDDLPAVERLRAARDAARHLTLSAIWRACAGGPPVPDEALERMRRLYAGAVRYMDDWLAGVLEALDGAGILDDTLVVVTSDHGENFGEGGLIGHAFSLDERLLRVPLVAAGPVDLPADGAPTLAALPRLLAEAIGLPEHPWTDEGPPVAVAQFDPAAGPTDPRVPKALAEWGLGEEAAWRITTAITSAVDGSLKLVRQGDLERLYDLASDPLEERPLTAPPAGREDVVDRLHAAVEHPAVRATGVPTPVEDPSASSGDLAQIERQMRLLGYL